MKKRSRAACLLIAEGVRSVKKRHAFQRAVKDCVDQGAQEVFFLSPAVLPPRTVKDDLPEEIRQAKRRYPAVDFHFAGRLRRRIDSAFLSAIMVQIQQDFAIKRGNDHGQ